MRAAARSLSLYISIYIYIVRLFQLYTLCARCLSIKGMDEDTEGEDEGRVGELARGARLFLDASGRPRCDEFGYDPYGNPFWNAIPKWMVPTGAETETDTGAVSAASVSAASLHAATAVGVFRSLHPQERPTRRDAARVVLLRISLQRSCHL